MNGKTKKYDRSRDCIAHFFSGRLYVLIAAILVFLGHTLAWELAVAAVMALSVLLGGFFCDDLRFFLPIWELGSSPSDVVDWSLAPILQSYTCPIILRPLVSTRFPCSYYCIKKPVPTVQHFAKQQLF